MYNLIILMIVFYAVSWTAKKMNKKIRAIFGIYLSMTMMGIISMALALAQLDIMRGKPFYIYYVFLSLPLMISIITWVSFIIMLKKRLDPVIVKPVSPSSMYCWVWYGLAMMMLTISIYTLRFSVYAPSLFHSSLPVPTYGVSIYMTGLILTSFFLYHNAGCKNVDHPEFHYWLTICVLMYLISDVALESLMLSYGMKVSYGTNYPYHAGILILSFIPILVCLISLAYKKEDYGGIENMT